MIPERRATGPRIRIGWLMALIGAAGLITSIIAAAARGRDVRSAIGAAWVVYAAVALGFIIRDARRSRPGGDER